MSTKKTQPDTLTPDQIGLVFAEIASTADVIQQLTSALQAEAFDAEEDAEAVQAAVHKLVGLVGFMADLYGSRCGAPYAMVKGGPDAWLMPGGFKTLDSATADGKGFALQ